jgi:hypothetical protein
METHEGPVFFGLAVSTFRNGVPIMASREKLTSELMQTEISNQAFGEAIEGQTSQPCCD